MSQKSKPDLSIVIVSYNTQKVLADCLQSIELLKTGLNIEVIVSDNDSSDDTIRFLKSFKSNNFKLIILENNQNLGFSKANNKAKKIAKAGTILFLNPDTLLHENSLDLPYQYLNNNSSVGAVTVKTLLPNGKLDPDTRRSFPTPWVSITHFTGLDKIFRHSMIFGQYQYGYINENTQHEIDVAQGAYLMVKKKVLDKVGWFDEDYFLDGEDIDLCWRIKKAGHKIVYYPDVYITHIKKVSKKADRRKSIQSVTRGVDAMRTFYRKNLESEYPAIVNILTYSGISVLKLARIIKHKLS